MKSNIIIIPIVILGFLMLGMMVTNPSLEDHRREALELLKKTVESDEASSSTDFKSQKKNVINLLVGTRIINTKINRTNLVLFSLTTLKTDEDNKIVGFGIFGSVILFKKTSYQLEWQIDQQNDESEKGNTKTSIKSKKIDVTDDKVQNENNIEQSNAYYSLGYYRPIAIDSKRVYFHNLPNLPKNHRRICSTKAKGI